MHACKYVAMMYLCMYVCKYATMVSNMNQLMNVWDQHTLV
jgi:hypothetical protein